MALYDASGNEIAGSMTAEEVQAKVAEATQAVREEEEQARVELQTSLETAKSQLDDTNKRLERTSDKDQNFANLRKLADEQAKAIEDLKTQVTQSEQNVTKIVTNRAKEEVISKLAGTDRDLDAKIRVHYERLIKLEQTVTDEVIARVAGDAYKLSVDNPQPSVLNRIGSSKPIAGAATNSESGIAPELVDAGRAFNISEDDIKKYGKN